jgi:isopentenyl phosphate kinase
LIVGHGGGSYPHFPAKEYKTHLGLFSQESLKGAALVQDAASSLNRIVVDALLKTGEPAVSVQASASAVAKDSKILRWDLEAVRLMLKSDFLPVPYGDLGLDVSQGVCILSTEEIFRFLAAQLKPKRIIIGTNVGGVYDSDPQINRDAVKIPLITTDNAKDVLPSLGGANTIDVTGGMRSKILTLLELVKETETECLVIGLLVPGALEDALNGETEKGTLIRR